MQVLTPKDRYNFSSTDIPAILKELAKHNISGFHVKSHARDGKVWAIQINNFANGELEWYSHRDSTKKCLVLPKYAYEDMAKHTRKGYIPGNKAHLIKRPANKNSDTGYSFITERKVK